MDRRTHFIRRLSLGAAIASLSMIAFAQDRADVAAPPDNPLANMPAEIIKAPADPMAPDSSFSAPSDVTTPQPTATPPEATLLAPTPDAAASSPSDLSLPQPPAPIDAALLQPLGVPQDRSKADEYRHAMNECSSKSGVELKACQDMVNSDYHVDPNSIRLSDQP